MTIMTMTRIPFIRFTMNRIPFIRFSLSVFLLVALLGIASHPAIVTAKKGGGRPRKPPPPNLNPSSEIFPTCRFSGGINFTVSPKFVGTTWRGWGTSLAWFANYVGGLPQKTQNKMLDLLFGKDNLALNIVRYNIGGGHDKKRSPQFYQTEHTDWRGMPGYKPTEKGPYDWSADERQRKVLQGAKERGANVFEAFSNSPPWWMTKSGDVAGPPLIGQSNLKKEYESAFANYLTTVVEQFAKKWGVTFDTLEPFNEALEGFWQAGNAHEGCSFDTPAMGRVIKYTSDSLKKKGLKTKLVGVDSWSPATAKLPQVANTNLPSRINVHSYMNKYDTSDVAEDLRGEFRARSRNGEAAREGRLGQRSRANRQRRKLLGRFAVHGAKYYRERQYHGGFSVPVLASVRHGRRMVYDRLSVEVSAWAFGFNQNTQAE